MRPAALVAGLVLLASACAGAAPTEADGGTSPAPGDGASDDSADRAEPTAGSTRPVDGPSADTSDAIPTGSPSATPAAQRRASCGQIERPPLQIGSHLLGDREPPVPYSSQPPTSGWHASGHFDVGVRGRARPLSEPEQVSVLEGGGVVVSHRGLTADDVARLRERVRSRYAGRVAVTPYDGISSGTVVFTAWGRLQRCDGVDLTALDRFVARFGPSGPVTPGH